MLRFSTRHIYNVEHSREQIWTPNNYIYVFVKLNYTLCIKVTSQVQEPAQALPDFRDNRNLRYLTSELTKCHSVEHRALVLRNYIIKCKFNCKFSPGKVIIFNDMDVEELVQWAGSNSLPTNAQVN